MRTPFLPFTFSLCSFLMGCGNPTLPSKNISQVAFTHIQQLNQTIDPVQIERFDREKNGAFQKVFGGHSSSDVQHFIQMRVKYFLNILSPAPSARISPPLNFHQGWWQFSSLITEDNPSESSQPWIAQTRTDALGAGAVNLSIQYWLQGLLDHRIYQIILSNGYSIPITDPREGVVSIGPRYSTSSSGQHYPIIVSQAMLVHESRHSDCSGGISQQDLQNMKNSRSYSDFINGHQNKHCGYLHEICPHHLTLGGIPACDSTPWGAYTVSAVFLDALLNNTTAFQHGTSVHHAAEWEIALIMLHEFKSRLTLNYDEIIRGHHGEPELSSSTAIH